MADQYIHQLPADGNNPNVAPQDIIPFSRNGVTYRGQLGGLLLPSASLSDVGKHLRVGSGGTPEWASAAVASSTIFTSSTGITRSTSVRTLTGTNRFSDFLLFVIGYGYGDGANENNFKWSPALFQVQSVGAYQFSNLRGTGWAEINTSGNNQFTLSSSDSTLKVFRIQGVASNG